MAVGGLYGLWHLIWSLLVLLGFVLGEIAPEADLASLKPDIGFRDQIDLDSMDILNFVVGLHAVLGVEIPEADYPRLATIEGCVEYLMAEARDRVQADPPRGGR